MDPRLQRRVQRYGWDKAAGHYERYWGEQLRPAQNLLLDLADPGPGEQVLDVACGPGNVTFPLARAVGTDGSVVGTDLSGSMVERLETEARAHGLPQVEGRRMDAESLSLEDSSFDLAVCSLGLMYAADPEKAIGELYRVLRPGGRAVVAVWGERNNCGWADIFPIVDARVSSEVCPLFFRLGTADLLERIFREVGFGNVLGERLTTILPYDSSDEALGAAFLGGPVALAYSRFDESTRKAVHAEYLESIEEFGNGAGGYAIPGEFVVVRGFKSE